MATRVWAASAAALNPTLLLLSSSARPSRPAPSTRPSGHLRLRSRPPRPARVVCRRAKNAAFEDYKFPDPIPEFAEQETSKFREHMTWRLEQKKEQYFGEHVEDIVDVCTEVLSTFLQHEYCGPGTLLVHPFLDMKGEIKERGLPGAPQAARAAIAWAEKNIDKDWKEWTGDF
ncbi:protein PLASTID REDOX INSENSITIVE 2, chloroplastic [Triticum urartu]|uniref:protein PLASTID REDOX INSENSITIVE 2, chloroplastic n=1 Tax=Triticum urartu TaxID=4572 RepID=UPI002043ED5D|nr:protein PLASTID REDOX INSENSITIVE 2, chloroplastic [Triticum urartu]